MTCVIHKASSCSFDPQQLSSLWRQAKPEYSEIPNSPTAKFIQRDEYSPPTGPSATVAVRPINTACAFRSLILIDVLFSIKPLFSLKIS